MATLYNSASSARKFIIGILIVTVFLLGYDFIVKNQAANSSVITNTRINLFKDPDLAFPFVPRLVIDDIPLSDSSNPDYVLDKSFTGVFPESAYVYKIEEPREKLDTIENALRTATALGFPTNCIASDDLQFNPEIASQVDKCTYEGDDYSFISANGTKTLEFDKTLSKWNMTTQLFTNISARSLTPLLSDPTQYSGAATSVLRSLGFGNAFGITNSYIEYAYASVDSAGNFFEPEIQSNARYVFIEVYRKFRFADPKTKQELEQLTTDELTLKNIPIAVDGIVYGNNPSKGTISLVGGNKLADPESDLFFMSFTDYEYSTRGVTRGIYSIITPSEAWTKVQQDQGFTVYLVPENGNSFEKYPNLDVRRFIADATRTSLAFYESSEWNGYTIPIYVFKGRAELTDGRQSSFTIFVDAIKRVN